VARVDAETYRIAAEHAVTGWDDFAASQLSFRYLMALALKFRAIKFDYFTESMRRDPALAALANKVHVTAPAEIDQLYPRLRPARVTITTANGQQFVRQADEALGSRLVPLDDTGLKAKFHGLVAPVLGSAAATDLAQQLWAIDTVENVTPLIEALAKPA
jgi:2-methylcitrate dehydratase PrpD